MSYFEIFHELIRISLSANMKIHHLNPTFDGLRVVNSDMLVFHIEQGIILIYIGDLDNMEYDAHVQSNAAPNNMVVECLRSIIEESFCDTHEKGLANANDESDSYLYCRECESDSENDSNFDFLYGWRRLKGWS